MPYTAGQKTEFPELETQSGVYPDGEGSRPTYIRSSVAVGLGHEDHSERMPHPFYQTPPNSESGEGKG